MTTTLNLSGFIQMKVLFLRCILWFICLDLLISKLCNTNLLNIKLILFYNYRYGPLVRHWTMRYEAKYSYFKKLCQSIGNFINLPHTLAMRHEYFQCYLCTSTDDLIDIEVGSGNSHVAICAYKIFYSLIRKCWNPWHSSRTFQSPMCIQVRSFFNLARSLHLYLVSVKNQMC